MTPDPTTPARENTPSFADIRAAHARIAPYVRRTPVMRSASLDALAGAQLFFKCENFQRTGSFKMRGAANAIFSLSDEEAALGVATHSSGNHAAAVARAARLRGARAWIVMPANSARSKLSAVRDFGGEITLCEPTVAAREAAADELIRRTGAVLVHPYDDDLVIAGQGTAAMEFLEEVPDLDVIVAPVSGGGLLGGTAIAAKHLRPAIRVVGAEPANADDAARSLAAGTLQPPSAAKTMADGLRGLLSPRTLAILRRTVDEIVLVGEEEIVAAMRLVWERLKLVVEPSAAVAAAPALLGKVHAGRKIGIILSGGNVDLDSLPFHRAAP